MYIWTESIFIRVHLRNYRMMMISSSFGQEIHEICEIL